MSVSVRMANFAGMMDDIEADNFRRIQLKAEVDRAADMIMRYREGIDFYRRRLNVYWKQLGRIAERLGEPEQGDQQ